MTSAEEIEAVSTPARQQAAPASERLLMEMVQQAMLDAGRDLRPFADGPAVRAVSEDAVRSLYYDRLAEKATPGEDAERFASRRQKAFRRTLNSAIKAKRLCVKEYQGESVDGSLETQHPDIPDTPKGVCPVRSGLWPGHPGQMSGLVRLVRPGCSAPTMVATHDRDAVHPLIADNLSTAADAARKLEP